MNLDDFKIPKNIIKTIIEKKLSTVTLSRDSVDLISRISVLTTSFIGIASRNIADSNKSKFIRAKDINEVVERINIK